MPFSVNSFVADAEDHVVFIDWQYANEDGTYSNRHQLATPAGDAALTTVTQETLVEWLENQLENTAEEFDAAISNAKAQAEYQAGFKKYEREADNTYALYVEKAEDVNVEVVEAEAST